LKYNNGNRKGYKMVRKRFKAEQIVVMLKMVDDIGDFLTKNVNKFGLIILISSVIPILKEILLFRISG